jgi:hypothetical protein
MRTPSTHAPIGYTLTRACTVHRRFAADGRASICLADRALVVHMSNCAPDTLNYFIRTLDAKMRLVRARTANAGTPKAALNVKRLYGSDLPLVSAVLSPLTVTEMRALMPASGKSPLSTGGALAKQTPLKNRTNFA